MVKLPKPKTIDYKPTCNLYTAQIGYRDPDKVVLNTTIKSGQGLGKLLAPTWDMVMSSKRGKITWDEYTRRYKILVLLRYSATPDLFRQLFAPKHLVICCYCADSAHSSRHCHRYLVRDIFAPLLPINLIDAGELTLPEGDL